MAQVAPKGDVLIQKICGTNSIIKGTMVDIVTIRSVKGNTRETGANRGDENGIGEEMIERLASEAMHSAVTVDFPGHF